MLFKISNTKRWKNENCLYSDWDERTKLLASQIKPNTTVLEFGAARLVLKDLLPPRCVYFHSDIVARNDETIVIDLNEHYPKIPIVDYIVFSGVLEYIYDVKSLLCYLTQFSESIIFSYATTDNFPNRKNRYINGWVSELSLIEIKEIANKLHWNCHIFGLWRG